MPSVRIFAKSCRRAVKASLRFLDDYTHMALKGELAYHLIGRPVWFSLTSDPRRFGYPLIHPTQQRRRDAFAILARALQDPFQGRCVADSSQAIAVVTTTSMMSLRGSEAQPDASTFIAEQGEKKLMELPASSKVGKS